MQNKEELLAKIKTSVEEIRPYLQIDGGDVEIIDVTDEFIVKIKLLGACSDCSMSTTTVKAGIEETIKRYIPEIVSVETIEE